jgi:hypothetical protein
MDYKELNNSILEIEKKHDVNKLIANQDVHIWPFIRFQLFTLFYEDSVSEEYISPKKNKNSLFKALIKNGIKIPLQLLKLKLLKKQNLGILFIGSNSHHININNQSQNKHYFPLFEKLIEEKKQFTYLNLSSGDIELGKYKINIASLVFYYFTKNKIFNTQFLNTDTKLLLDEIIADFCKNNIKDKNKFTTKLTKRLNIFYANLSLFKNIVSKINIDKAFILCYYDSAMMPFTYYCRKNNISTVDVQHGGQGDLHLAYSNFTKVPKDGYNTLPKYFWVWNEDSKVEIEKWQINQQFHQTIVGGNPWLLYNKNLKRNNPLGAKKTILFTLYLMDIEPELHSLIKNSPEDYVWQLKPHPRREKELTYLETCFKEEIISGKVKILPHDLNIIELLLNSSVHVTKISSTIIEAEQMGVYSIVIDEMGILIFKKNIASGKTFALYPLDSKLFNSLLIKIENLPSFINNSETIQLSFDAMNQIK